MESNIDILKKKISDLEKDIENWKFRPESGRRAPQYKWHLHNISSKELIETIINSFEEIETRLNKLENSK